jgi:prepilin-type N-terminal cleavage/methylation domain-containing protein
MGVYCTHMKSIRSAARGVALSRSKGFTLIELLVVIAIIGLLAAVVLASVGSARTKGGVAAAKQEMNSIRTAAELYANTNNGYGAAANCTSSLFADTVSNMASAMNGLFGIPGIGSSNVDCGSSATNWSVAVKVPDGTYWCADSNGTARGATAGGTTYSALTGSATAAHTSAAATACN